MRRKAPAEKSGISHPILYTEVLDWRWPSFW